MKNALEERFFWFGANIGFSERSVGHWVTAIVNISYMLLLIVVLSTNSTCVIGLTSVSNF